MSKPTLVVMAAGMGSRFGGLKQLEPIGRNGEAILDFSIYDAAMAGFDKMVIIIKKAIEKDFRETAGKRLEEKYNVEYVFQEIDDLPDGYKPLCDRQKPWGTAHAIWCARNAIGDNQFAVINADDYYGRSTYVKMAEHFASGSDDYAMIGFRLNNTLTENGTVARGVCETENGYLTNIRELTKINSQCQYTMDEKEWTQLDPESVVSMNIWGLDGRVFPYLERELKLFLDKNAGEMKEECYLPLVMGTLIKNNEAQVKVIPCEERWYGVTYREDKESVVSAITKFIDEGKYDKL